MDMCYIYHEIPYFTDLSSDENIEFHSSKMEIAYIKDRYWQNLLKITENWGGGEGKGRRKKVEHHKSQVKRPGKMTITTEK